VKLNPQQERNVLNELEESYQYHVNTGGFSEPTRVKGSDKLETWVITENFYPGWEKFLKLFDDKIYDTKKDKLMDYVFYTQGEMEYPEAVDPELDFQKFIKKCLIESELPITMGKCLKAWGLKYPPGSYSGMHCHQPGRQLSVVMFLDDVMVSEQYPLAGSLVTLQPFEHEINHVRVRPTPGGVVIMDGRVFHGTYPTLNNRRVFVCDFSYEVN
jgi:hypothetical protein|tara:strand:+ start:164 stop:805 length:642 start_codon:yes stop_codon:yes gene_type:complete